MTRNILFLGLPLLALSACNVDRDAGNDTTTLSVDEQKVDTTLDQAGNLAEDAAGEVKQAADKAGPVLKDAAQDVGNAADRAGDKIENGADRAGAEVRQEGREARQDAREATSNRQ